MKFNDASDKTKIALLAMALGSLHNRLTDEHGKEEGEKSLKQTFAFLDITPTQFAKLSQDTDEETDKEISEISGYDVSLLHLIRYVKYDLDALEKFSKDYQKIPLVDFRRQLIEHGVIDKPRPLWKYHHQLCEILRRFNICRGRKLELKLSKTTK